MPGQRFRGRAPRGTAQQVALRTDADVLAGYREDAAHFPGGHAQAIATPSSEAEIAALIASSSRVLVVGAQSSLTGGATPMGDVVLSTAKLNRIVDIGEQTVRAQAGVTLLDLDAALASAGKYYPPVPTFLGAFVGGVVSTNAAGAATFRYGTTRDWVQAITVVLADGSVLDIERGAACAHTDGYFEIDRGGEVTRVPIPTYRMPHVPKLSAGYFARPAMDLIDLFIGAEGTLGVIVEVTLRIVPQRPSLCLAFVPIATRDGALRLVDGLRKDPAVAAIEHMDARCLALLREDGADRQFGVRVPEDAAIALLITLELRGGATGEEAFDEIGRFREIDTPLARLCRALDQAGVLDAVEIAVPGDTARATQLLGIREAVPAAVNARVARAKAAIDERIAKTAADMIVPFDKLPELMRLYDGEFSARRLDAAVWGHISDGNLHPNVIPRSMADVESGKEAIRAFGRAVIEMGGAPLAEHGVGRNPIKQALLRDLYGVAGISQMRRVKEALDPGYKLGRGVIFDATE
jgi:D-lactate dehydrogenase (cytochrome)